MTMDGGHRREAVFALLVALLLLGLWWWYRNDASAVATAATSAAMPGDAPEQEAARPAAARPLPPAASRIRDADEAGTLCAAHRHRQIRALRASMDPAESPDSALTHALLRLPYANGTDAVSPIWQDIAAARERWPDNADLAWFETRHCDESRGCDRRAAQARWQALEPRNAAVWIEAMGQARAGDGNDVWEAALSNAAAADFYDSRLGLTFVQVRSALARLPLPPDCERTRADMSLALGRDLTAGDLIDIEAQAVEIATALPSFLGLQRCRPQDPRWNPRYAARCAAVLRKIGEGDTFVEQGLALAWLIPLVDEPEARQLRERYRRLRWLMSSAAVADRIPGYIPRMWAEGETAVLQDWLHRHGR